MKQIVILYLMLLSGFFAENCYAATTLGISNIVAKDSSGNIITNTLSNVSTTQNLGTLSFTLTGINFNFTDNTSGPVFANNWGVYFGSGAGVLCSLATPCQFGTTPDGVTMTVDSSQLPSVSPSSSGTNTYTATGSLGVILDFTKATPTANQFPQDIKNLITSTTTGGPATLTIGILYQVSGSALSAAAIGPSGVWQPEQGTLLNPPTLALHNQSVIAGDGQVQVTNISPPSSLAAVCPSTSTGTCANDGATASGATGTLITPPTTPTNTVSGYVIGYWTDSDCKMGGFTFSPNWMAYAYTYPVSNYGPASCIYPSWQSETATGTGGVSSILGCSVGSPLFYSGQSAETAAIPYISGNPKLDLYYLISNPGQSTKAADSCVNYVYLSNSGSSSSTYTFNVNNGTVYGVVVWALNSAQTTDSQLPAGATVPNYSLAHSNIFYTTGVNIALASTAKSPGLSLTKDCFVVTAASGNENSPSVYYWRILRDAYLTPIGFTKFYYQHAKTWAHWLDQHPSLKPPLNFIFEKSGYAFVHGGQFIENTFHKTRDEFHKFVNYLSSLFDNKAEAEEKIQAEKTEAVPLKQSAFTQVPNNNRHKSDFGFDQDDQETIDVVPDDINNAPFFKPRKAVVKKPKYEIALLGGALIPTDDKVYYDAYYSSQPSWFGQLSISRIYWASNFGFSLGLQGRYLANSGSGTVSVLGDPESYNLHFYSLTAEAIFGIRYKNPNFVYLQPGIFAGGGATRFREDATPVGANSTSSQGVTQYSAIYEGGVTLDLSLTALAGTTAIDQGDVLNEVLFRAFGSYNQNPTPALSSTGYFVGGGFVFTLN